jgi:hypothetical protein
VSSDRPGERIAYRRAVLERRPDGLEITLLPVGFRGGAGDALLIGLILGIIWCLCDGSFLLFRVHMASVDSSLPLSLGELVVWLGVGSLGLVGPFLIASALARRGGVISLADGRLTIRRQDWLGCSRWAWKRSQILTIAAGGLWVIDLNAVYCLFTERDHAEMAWVAGALREALDLDDGPSDSLRVVLQGRWWDKPLPARLHARRGRLTIHRTDAYWPYVCFDAVPAPLFLQAHRILTSGKPFRLAPGDTICRIETDGSARLQITPSGTRFQLTLHCHDGLGLQQALGRFWGAADEAAP